MAVSVANMSVGTHHPWLAAATAGCGPAGVRRLFGHARRRPEPRHDRRGGRRARVHAGPRRDGGLRDGGRLRAAHGHAGVAVVTRGPGVTSAVNGLAQATLDRAPLLLVSDCVAGDQRATRGPPAARPARVHRPGHPVERRGGAHRRRRPPPRPRRRAGPRPARGRGAPRLRPGRAGRPTTRARAAARARSTRRARCGVRDGPGAAAVRSWCSGWALWPHAAALRAVLTGSGIPVADHVPGHRRRCPTGSAEWAGPFTNAALERPLLEQADLVIGVGLDAVEPILPRGPTAAPRRCC